jgi:hypothetical protein
MSEGFLGAGPSLLNTAYQHCIDLWVVFTELDHSTRQTTRSPFWRLLKPGFRHVECWKYVPPGAWLRFNTGIELTATEVFIAPPWEVLEKLNPTPVRVQRFVRQGSWREPFFLGPITCVEQVKGFLGLRDALIRTPHQLYRKLLRE